MKKNILLFIVLLLLICLFVVACDSKKTVVNHNDSDTSTGTQQSTGDSGSSGNSDNSGNSGSNNSTNTFIISWKNWDGSLLKREAKASGSMPSYSGTPTRQNEGEYTYTFTGWNPEIKTLTNNVTYIAQYDFDNRYLEYEFDKVLNGYSITNYTGSIENLRIPSKHNGKPVVSIGSEAFHGKTTIKSVEFPNSLIRIDAYAFQECTGITSIDLPDSIKHLGSGAFLSCSNLRYVELPKYLESVDEYYPIFYNCTNLVYNISNDIKYLGSEDNDYLLLVKTNIDNRSTYIINSQCKFIERYAFSYNGYLTSIVIPGSVNIIGDSAFVGCTSLGSVTISTGVKTIRDSAFNGCQTLTNLTIPNSVTYIGDYAFYNCKAIETITVPESVKYIGYGAFRGCEELKTISIPNSVEYVGGSIVLDCEKLELNSFDNAFYIGNNTNPYLYLVKVKNKDITGCEINSNCKIVPSYVFDECTKLSDITIADGVVYLSNSFADECENLQSLHIGKNVKQIGEGLGEEDEYYYQTIYLYDKKSLNTVTVDSENQYYDSRNNCNAIIASDTNTLIFGCNISTIPNGVTRIGNFAFYYCMDMTTIVIPNTVESIGIDAFCCDEKLSSIVIPNSVKAIEYGAFCYCQQLTTINFGGTKAEWNNIFKGEDWDEETGPYSVYCTDGVIDK